MGIANLHGTVQEYIQRKNLLNYEISVFQSQKRLGVLSRGDAQSLFNSEKTSIRNEYRAIYEDSEELQELYSDYTEIPEFEEEIERLEAQLQEELDELTAWETAIDAQITTKSTELEEIRAYEQSFKSMQSTNTQEDFNFGLNG